MTGGELISEKCQESSVDPFVAKPDNVYTFDCAFLAQSLKQKYGIK